MATYVIGDIHGCYATLRSLLSRIGYSKREDRLWLVGDLVNRGPRSSAVLRWAAELGDDRVTAVLGNHDLHLLARAAGLAKERRRDTLGELFAASDRDDLLAWLRRRPLFHRDGAFAMVHAGLLPEWSLDEAEALARDAEAALAGDESDALLGSLRAELPEGWSADLPDFARRRWTLSAFTRLRTLVPGKGPCSDFSGPPDEAPTGCVPWFEVPGRRNREGTLFFGHWAAMGFVQKKGVVALDTGCAWGRELSAMRLEDGKLFRVPALESS